MTTPAYTEALERALGRVIADARREMEAVTARCDAALAQMQLKLAEAESKSAAIEAALARRVDEFLATVPMPQDGKDADPETIRAMVDEAVARIPTPRDGKDGTLPICKEWSDRVHYEGEVVTRYGATWQAVQTTGKEPPHADWICLASAGRDGSGFVYRGTFDADAEYVAGDVVMRNGSSFVAKADAPGDCPGEGWGLMASRGSKGQVARENRPATAAKPSPVSLDADTEGRIILTLDDGRTLEADLYPVLSRLDK